MVTPHIALRLLAATVLLSGVALAGSAMAKPTAGETAIASAATTSVPTEVAATAPVSVDASAGGCARKVKVVYAGYGEAARASCGVASATAAAK
jgi:hypothetical protein